MVISCRIFKIQKDLEMGHYGQSNLGIIFSISDPTNVHKIVKYRQILWSKFELFLLVIYINDKESRPCLGELHYLSGGGG